VPAELSELRRRGRCRSTSASPPAPPARRSASRSRSTPADCPVAGIQNDITFDPLTPIAATGGGQPDCTANPATGKSIFTAFRPSGCTPGADLYRHPRAHAAR
jgi:hypothetical protein